jgi:hypothetical protein
MSAFVAAVARQLRIAAYKADIQGSVDGDPHFFRGAFFVVFVGDEGDVGLCTIERETVGFEAVCPGGVDGEYGRGRRGIRLF